jgi:hypothetical protein
MPVKAGPDLRPATFPECYEPPFTIVKPGLGSGRMRTSHDRRG